MTPEQIAAVAACVAALCAAAAWHAARINATKLEELKRQTDGRWHESMDSARREYRALGNIEGGQHERDDQDARMSRDAKRGYVVSELTAHERHVDGSE